MTLAVLAALAAVVVVIVAGQSSDGADRRPAAEPDEPAPVTPPAASSPTPPPAVAPEGGPTTVPAGGSATVRDDPPSAGDWRSNSPHPFKLDHPRLGPIDARVKIVEFFDYGCSHCEPMAETLDQLVRRAGDVAVYPKFFQIRANSEAALRGGAAAAMMSDTAFAHLSPKLFHAGDMTERGVFDVVRGEGTDMDLFGALYRSSGTDELLKTDEAEARDAGVDAVPTLFIDGRKYEGPIDLDSLLRAVSP
ncbi:MAG TPA: thioredoxin domain-containing protein [Kofleriaceae bacterium]|nr:thioredoxin domain-containing protein [Kofleriaceae bacterium]